MEPAFHTTVLLRIIGANMGIMVVTSMARFLARVKVTRKGSAKSARFILLSFLDHPCVGLNGWCPLRDADGGGRYDCEM